MDESRSRIMDIKEVSVFLHVGRSTIWKLIKEEGLPSFRIGRKRLFDEKDLRIWVDTRKESLKC